MTSTLRNRMVALTAELKQVTAALEQEVANRRREEWSWLETAMSQTQKLPEVSDPTGRWALICPPSTYPVAGHTVVARNRASALFRVYHIGAQKWKFAVDQSPGPSSLFTPCATPIEAVLSGLAAINDTLLVNHPTVYVYNRNGTYTHWVPGFNNRWRVGNLAEVQCTEAGWVWRVGMGLPNPPQTDAWVAIQLATDALFDQFHDEANRRN